MHVIMIVIKSGFGSASHGSGPVCTTGPSFGPWTLLQALAGPLQSIPIYMLITRNSDVSLVCKKYNSYL